jgi:hypothetical protein
MPGTVSRRSFEDGDVEFRPMAEESLAAVEAKVAALAEAAAAGQPELLSKVRCEVIR